MQREDYKLFASDDNYDISAEAKWKPARKVRRLAVTKGVILPPARAGQVGRLVVTTRIEGVPEWWPCLCNGGEELCPVCQCGVKDNPPCGYCTWEIDATEYGQAAWQAAAEEELRRQDIPPFPYVYRYDEHDRLIRVPIEEAEAHDYRAAHQEEDDRLADEDPEGPCPGDSQAQEALTWEQEWEDYINMPPTPQELALLNAWWEGITAVQRAA